MSKKRIIIGINVSNRKETSSKVQNILTEYGCSIKTRLGLHEASEEFCSVSGIIILELVSEDKSSELCEKLSLIEGIDVQTMVF